MGRSTGADGFQQYAGFWWKLALPVAILCVHLGIITALSAWALSRPASSVSVVLMGMCAGWMLWTPFEYAMHRWLLHHTRRPLVRRIFWEASHRDHHAYRTMMDPAHHGVHLAITVPLVMVLVCVVAISTTGGLGLALSSGWILGYWSYEALHWLFHAGDPGAGLGRLGMIRRLWEAHTCHHLLRGDANYGFVTLFWDRWLGTGLEEARHQRTAGAARGCPEAVTPAGDPDGTGLLGRG